MTNKITWREPESDDVTLVEISRSSTQFGSYSVLTDTLDATSDGNAKSSSNTWVTEYIDTSGSKTDWYKIRFWDSTNSVWSDYSDPLTAEETAKLCTIDEIKNTIDTVGRWTDAEIWDAISFIEDLMYDEFGRPLKAMWTDVGKIDSDIQYTYYVGESPIYRVDKVFFGTTTKHQIFEWDEYKTSTTEGMVRVLTAGSGGTTLTTNDEIEVHFVPKIFNRIAIYRTVRFLLDQLDFTSSGETSKEVEVIEKRLMLAEQILQNRIGLQLSSTKMNYDKHYGVNREKVIQDHDRNKYISSYAFS